MSVSLKIQESGCYCPHKESITSKPRFKELAMVSGLCFMSKWVEWVFVKELMQLNNRNNLDNPKEPAYKTGHSTETALPHIKNQIISYYHVASPRHLYYSICQLHLTKLAILLFLIVLNKWFIMSGTALIWSHSLLATDSMQLKLGQHNSCLLDVQ